MLTILHLHEKSREVCVKHGFPGLFNNIQGVRFHGHYITFLPQSLQQRRGLYRIGRFYDYFAEREIGVK